MVGALRFLAVKLWLVWQRKRGVLVKEVDRANQEIVPQRRHNRPVFQADNVMEA